MYTVFHRSLQKISQPVPIKDVGMAGTTFILCTIPQTGKEHQLPIFTSDIMRHFLLSAGPLLEPFIESLADYHASLLAFHGCPHPLIFGEGVVATVYCAHHGPVVGLAFCPEGD